MFTDLVGFTGLAQEDEAGALRLLEEKRRWIRPVLRRHHGREVKTIGDAFLVEFASALAAVECALEIQRTDRDRSAGREAPVGRLRIGIHLGDVVGHRGDILGDAVNLASRIEPLADPGGICVSQQVADQVANKIAVPLTRLAPRPLKNVRVPIGVYKLELGEGPGVPLAPPPGRRRLAVLPIRSLGSASEDEMLADGLTEELILRLARLEGMHVLARSSVTRYRSTAKTVAEIARELGVEAVLEATVRRAGLRLRLTAMLVDAKTEEPLWSEAFDSELRDVFGVQSELAERIASSLQVRLAPKELEQLRRPSTSVPAAYAAYLRGRFFWNRRTADGLVQAIGEYEEALRQDPTFALAHAGLADVRTAQALLEFVRPTEAFPLARADAERAIALDAACAEAFTALGVVRFQFDRDWQGAEEALRRAIALNPRYAPAHHQFADLLKALGRFDEALTEIRTALELDPLSLAVNTGVGHVLYLARRYDEAIAQYRRTLELDPSFVLAHLWFGRPYLEQGRYAEAIAELEKALTLSQRSTMAMAVLAHAYASARQPAAARRLLAELRARARSAYVPSYWIGLVYVGLGEADAAFRWFDRAFEERSSWLTWVMVEPRFDRLRGDSRFARLLRRMGLPPGSAGAPEKMARLPSKRSVPGRSRATPRRRRTTRPTRARVRGPRGARRP
jgi:adenylate cyclase